MAFELQYFSKRYDQTDTLNKDVETLDFLFTGLLVGFNLFLLTRIMTNEPDLEPKEFSAKLIKWSGINIGTKKLFFDALEDILNWSNEHAMEVYKHGIKTLYLFRPEDFDKWNLTFESAKWN